MDSQDQGNAVDRKVGRYFDQASATFDTFYNDQRGAFMRWVDHRFRKDMYVRFDSTLEEIGNPDGKSILDIGCGSGPYSVECARRGAKRVLGLDLADGMLRIAQQRARDLNVEEKCEFRQGTFPNDAPDEMFDHCIVMGVMDYIPDPREFLGAVLKCTKRTAILSFPSVHWFRAPLRKVRYKLKRCPLYLYREAQIRECMNAVGFHDISVEKISGAGMDYVAVGRTQNHEQQTA